jgi:hypothetical protein
MKRFSYCWTVCLLLLGAYVLAAAPSGYHLLKKIPFGAAPGSIEYFDYITFDAATRRVYLSHGTEVKVLNMASKHDAAILLYLLNKHRTIVPRMPRIMNCSCFGIMGISLMSCSIDIARTQVWKDGFPSLVKHRRR